MVRSRLIQSCLLAMLMLIGQVIPAHGTRCEGCLMHPVGAPDSVSAAPAAASGACARGCCSHKQAAHPQSPEKSTPHSKKCGDKCNCPGACCATGQVLGLVRMVSVDLPLLERSEPAPNLEASVCARDAHLSLLRPPRS